MMAIFRRGPLTGASNAGGVDKNRDTRPISGYRIDNCWIASNNLPHRPPHISESCLSQPVAWTTTTKRQEQNLIVYLRSAKSEAEVTNDRRLRSTYCTIEANYYWQTRSIPRPLCESRATCFIPPPTHSTLPLVIDRRQTELRCR